MQEINHAVSLLTGLQGDALAGYSGVRMAYKEMGSTAVSAGGVDVTISFGMSLSEAHAADWIYTSAFAADGGRAFIATYSGKVLDVGDSGEPIRSYGIGNVPRRIIDTGDYVYLLTDSRLYVLRNGALLTLIDISDGGDVVVAQTGFGLLEQKRFEILKFKLDSGFALVEQLASSINSRLFGLQRVLWAIESNPDELDRLWKEYYVSVIEWNRSPNLNQMRILRLAGENEARAFLDWRHSRCHRRFPRGRHFRQRRCVKR
jgi:hypothetical protein